MYRIFPQILQKKNLFEILGLTGSVKWGPNWEILAVA